MKVLIAGANGYIGSRLLSLLLEQGCQVVALMRHVTFPIKHERLEVIAVDLLEHSAIDLIPKDIDVAFYLVHAMSYGKDFAAKEDLAIRHFLGGLSCTSVRQVIYLSGLCSDPKLSPHLASRYNTECQIKQSGLPYTILRAGIIIGSGSASFEIIRDLVEKLPVMVAPRWVDNLCQPIAVEDVLYYLIKVIGEPRCLNQKFDIGGPEQLSYKQMLQGYAKVRGLKRPIFVLPLLTPKLSSYWLYFVTSVNFSLASTLVDSLKNQAICQEFVIREIFDHACMGYESSVQRALDVIEQNPLIPSWKDALLSPTVEAQLGKLATVPSYGCFVDQRRYLSTRSRQELIEKIWSIGGKSGWYYMDWAWSIRGFMDKLFGGVGLQRGRADTGELRSGSALDFWRVVVADKSIGRLLLYAEMKVPGEAWLEFRIESSESGDVLVQTASFRSKGVLGSLYWYLLLPLHVLIFKGMAKAIALKA